MSDQVKVMELKQQPSGLMLFAMSVGSELVHDTYIWLNNTSELNYDDSHRTFFFQKECTLEAICSNILLSSKVHELFTRWNITQLMFYNKHCLSIHWCHASKQQYINVCIQISKSAWSTKECETITHSALKYIFMYMTTYSSYYELY